MSGASSGGGMPGHDVAKSSTKETRSGDEDNGGGEDKDQSSNLKAPREDNSENINPAGAGFANNDVNSDDGPGNKVDSGAGAGSDENANNENNDSDKNSGDGSSSSDEKDTKSDENDEFKSTENTDIGGTADHADGKSKDVSYSGKKSANQEKANPLDGGAVPDGKSNIHIAMQNAGDNLRDKWDSMVQAKDDAVDKVTDKVRSSDDGPGKE